MKDNIDNILRRMKIQNIYAAKIFEKGNSDLNYVWHNISGSVIKEKRKKTALI